MADFDKRRVQFAYALDGVRRDRQSSHRSKMEQQLTAALREGQIAEFIEDDEFHACQVIGKATLATGAGLGLKPIDEIERFEETAA